MHGHWVGGQGTRVLIQVYATVGKSGSPSLHFLSCTLGETASAMAQVSATTRVHDSGLSQSQRSTLSIRSNQRCYCVLLKK